MNVKQTELKILNSLIKYKLNLTLRRQHYLINFFRILLIFIIAIPSKVNKIYFSYQQDVTINMNSVKNLDLLLNYNRQKIILTSQEIDGLLLQLLAIHTPEELLDINNDLSRINTTQRQQQHQSNELPQEDSTEPQFDDDNTFEITQAITLQQELLQQKNNQNKVKPKVPQQVLRYVPQNQKIKYQEKQKVILQDQCQIIPEEAEESLNQTQQQEDFKQLLQHNIEFYQNELRKSYNERNSIERKSKSPQSPNVFSDRNEKNKIMNSEERLSPTKFEVKQESQPKINNFVKEKTKIQQQIKQRAPSQKKQTPSVQKSLVGSLFTPAILKEMKQLNEDTLKSEQVQANRPEQSQGLESDITIQFVSEQQQQQSQSLQINEHLISDQSNQDDQVQHSQLKIQLLCDIRNILEEPEVLEEQKTFQQQQDFNPQLLSQVPEIFDFLVHLNKELQGKGRLTKILKLKIQEQYSKINFLTKKSRGTSISQIKKKTENTIDDNLLKTIKSVQKSFSFFTPAFILNTKLPTKGQPILFQIYSTLITLIGLLDADFNLPNQRMPDITWDFIKKSFANPSRVSNIIKNASQFLQSQELVILTEFEKQFIKLDTIVEEPSNFQILKQQETYLLIRMIYFIKYLIDCLKDQGKLRIINNPIPQLNSNINSLYEEQIWKQKGNRYGAAKSQETLIQQERNKIYEQFGVDFASWELNLQIQEEEVKKMEKVEKELDWKENRNQKQTRIKENKKKEEKILEDEKEQV